MDFGLIPLGGEYPSVDANKSEIQNTLILSFFAVVSLVGFDGDVAENFAELM